MVKCTGKSRFDVWISAAFTSPKVRIAFSVIFALALAISGLIVLGLHLIKIERQDAKVASEKVLHYVENLLNEANVAAERGWLTRDILCNEKKSRNLDILIARYPHIRGLNFIENGRVWCSSLSGNKIRLLPDKLKSIEKMGMLPGDEVTPDIPVLYYFIPVHNGHVLISINGLFILNAFQLAGVETPSFIQIGDSRVTNRGDVFYANKSQHYQYERVESGFFPISVSFESPTKISWHKYWLHNLQLIFFLILLSTGAGWCCWRVLSHMSSPVQALRHAINNRKIIPYYQPVYDSVTKEISGFEVLARWKQDDVFISPDVFIPLAEQAHLIVPLTRTLLDHVIQDLQKVISGFPQHIHIGLNISAEHFVNNNLLKDIQHMLTAFNPHLVKIVLEITERQSMETTAEALENIEALKKMGVAIALDDFGTGYSNLAWISQLKPDFIKIDKLFVAQIDQGTETTLVDSVIELAQKMHLQLIAEGVETIAQVNYLQNKKIDFLQGYYFSRPVSAEQFIRLMTTEESH